MNKIERDKLILKDLKKTNKLGVYKYTQQEIADKYHVDRSLVSKIGKKYNAGRYKNEKSEINKRDELILKYLEELDEYGKYKYTYKEISKKMNMPVDSIIYIKRKYRFIRDIDRLRKNLNEENIIKDLQELDDIGNYKYTQKELGNKYGLSQPRINNIMKKYNLKRRNK